MIVAFAAQALLSVGPAALTYPELAAALTKAGMPTVAVANLRSRGAYVCLRNRRPEAVRRLLGEALGVVFEPQGAGWRMATDPAVKERDRQFLLAYRKLAATNFRHAAAQARDIAKGRTYRAFLADVQDAFDGIEGSPKLKEASRNDLLARSWLAQPNLWNGSRAVETADAVNAIERPRFRTFPFRLTGLPHYPYNPRRETNGASMPDSTPFSDDTPVRQTFRFDPRTAVLSIDTDVRRPVSDGRGAVPFFSDRHRLYAGVTPITPYQASAEVEDVTATFRALGPAAQSYWESLPMAKLPEGPKLKEPPSSLSEAIEAFGVEAAMELSPRFETFWSPEAPRAYGALSLRTLFTVLPGPGAPMFGANGWIGQSNAEANARSRHMGERSWPWRAVERDGALLIVNPYAFLDRTQSLPAAPYLRLSRILNELPPQGQPNWAMAKRLVAAAKPELQLVDVRDAQTPYRISGNVNLAPYQVLVEAIEAVPAPSRPAVWKTLAEAGKMELPWRDGSATLQMSESGGYYTLFASYADANRDGRFLGGSQFDGRGTLLP